MPIALPVGLPAIEILRSEGLDILIGEQRGPDRRPLRVCLINLMPNKVATETQIARLLGAASVSVELTLCVPDAYRPKNTSAHHLGSFYRPWTDICKEPFDGLIVTGAPVETLPFEEVTYWPDLCRMFEWARSRSIHAFFICWAAQAALYHFHRVPKHPLLEKMFGVFRHQLADRQSQLVRSFPEEFMVPVSRHTETRAIDLPLGLKVVSVSPAAGLCLLEDQSNRTVYMFNHLEYDAETLKEEFLRDRRAGKIVNVPQNYFPSDDPQQAPTNVWRAWGELLIANWVEHVHQTVQLRQSDQALMQWALSPPSSSPTENCSAFLISGAASAKVLASLLSSLTDLGIPKRSIVVHLRPGLEEMIEVSTHPLETAALEKVAQRLSGLHGSAKVAFRNSSGGGWLMGKNLSGGSITRSQAA